ncbi:hypothetical protein ONZ45_g16593 [Pleurotus djamor]|nr:hypothetical protein ONZ45_g16593 [Pleurotus djamor]
MSRGLDVEDVRRLFPHHTMPVAPDGSRQLRLECTGRVLSLAVINDFKKTSRTKLNHAESAALFENLTPEERICDACRIADRELQCKLSFTDRLRIDILCQRYLMSLPEAVELYRPFACRETDLGLTEDGTNANTNSEQASSNSPAQTTHTHQSSSRSVTSTRFRPRSSIARKYGYPHFRDIEEGESQSPTASSSHVGLKVRPSSLRKRTQSVRRTILISAGDKRRRSVSPAASRRRARRHSPSGSSDIEVIPSSRLSKSSPSKEGATLSIEDQLDALRHEVEAWKEKTFIAQDEVESMHDLAVHYEYRSEILEEELAQERQSHLDQREQLVTVQELARASAELEPNGTVSLPTLAMWMMSESAGLTFLHRSLSSASVPESPSEPVLLGQGAYSASLALIASQHEGLNNWLVGHLPGFQHLVINTAQEGVVAPSEERYRRIEDAARLAREDLELERLIEENRVAAEEEKRQKEIEKKKAQQEALCAKFAETREAARMAKEAQDKLQAELADLGVEIPPSPPDH